VTKQHPIIRAVATQKKTYSISKDQFLSEKLEGLLTKLLLLEMDFLSFADSKKLNLLCENPDYFELFSSLDFNKNGFLDLEDIDMFLRKRNIVLFEEEILTLIIKFDTDSDKRLNFDEFLRFIFPSQLTTSSDLIKIRATAKDKFDIEYYQQIKQMQNEIKYNTIKGISINKREQFEENSNKNTLQTEKFLNESTKLQTNQNNLNNSVAGNDQLLTQGSKYKSIYNQSSSKSLDKLIYELYNQIKLDKKLELIKQDLSFLDDFNLITVFKFFDQRKMDSLTEEDVVLGLKRLGLFSSFEEINLIFSRLDKNGSGRIKYNSILIKVF
jgi:Ca2+-binding EF-hand superfamily protein